LGLQKELVLGNLDAYRDWSYTGDVVEAIYLMMNNEKPEDYVICSGESHSIRDFLKVIFEYAELGSYEDYVRIDKKYFRPSEVDHLLGDPTKIKKLGWKPKIKFDNLIKLMYNHDLQLVKGGIK